MIQSLMHHTAFLQEKNATMERLGQELEQENISLIRRQQESFPVIEDQSDESSMEDDFPRCNANVKAIGWQNADDLVLHEDDPYRDYLSPLAAAAGLPLDNQFVSRIKKRLELYPFALKLYAFFPSCQTQDWPPSFPEDSPSWEDWQKKFPACIEQFRSLLIDEYTDFQAENPLWWDQGISWIQSLARRFRVVDRLIQDLSRLTPDIDATNKCDWKDQFEVRYAALLQAGNSLAASVDTVPEVLTAIREKAQQVPVENGWLRKYLEETVDRLDLLEAQCTQLARYFKVSFEPASFAADLLQGTWMKEMTQYFEVAAVTRDTVTQQVDVFFKSFVSEAAACPLTALTFQEHIRYYFNRAVQSVTSQHEMQWQTYYREWLGRVGITTAVPREQFAAVLQDVTKEGWLQLYRQWLQELELDESTPRDTFLNALKTYKKGINRKKRIKTEDTWTPIEIQNLFMVLYREFFILKWQHVRNKVPTDSEVLHKLEQKMNLLEKIHPNQRQNILMDVYEQYIQLDLATWTRKEDLIHDITNTDTLLKRAMQDTEKILEEKMQES